MGMTFNDDAQRAQEDTMAPAAVPVSSKRRSARRIVLTLIIVGLMGTVGGVLGLQWWDMQRLEQQRAAMNGPAKVGLSTIGMNGSAYTAPHVEVAAGTVVTWTNDEDNEHDVIFIDGTPGSPLLAYGERWSMAFDQPGRYQYVCSRHAFMVGKVTVTP
jgi:plastocyanin